MPSENKRDHRTIEEVLAETRAKKKLKTETQANPVGGSQGEGPISGSSVNQTSEIQKTVSDNK